MYVGRSLLFYIFLVLVGRVPVNYGARILCVFQSPAVSHQMILQPISRELSLRGHEVISVTSLPINDPRLTNLTEIDTSYTMETFEKFRLLDYMSVKVSICPKVMQTLASFDEAAEVIFENKQFKKIYTDPNQKFDLIIAQTYLNPIMYALSHKFKAPIIGISSMGVWTGSHVAMGNPNPPALYSDMYLPYNGDLTFYERIKSTLYFLWTRVYLYYIAIPRGDAIARKYLGSDLPYLADIERNVSAIFLTINPIIYIPRPMVPTMVPINFVHVQPPKPLPEDLRKEIESAKNGVVYFSLGSNVRSAGLSERLRNLFMEVMAELPYKVLWKFEEDELPGKPKNVVIRKWFPQQDVLAHPNVKVFVTQGGLQSFDEAVDREVPFVGIPFISEQEMNLRQLYNKGIARWIDYENTTKEELLNAIIETAENPSYREKIKKIKKLLQDQPETGLERAMWWSEYIIRHKGTAHLKSPTADIEWYKYLLLDVFAVLIGGVILGLIVIVQIVKFLLNELSKGNKITSKSKIKAKKQ